MVKYDHILYNGTVLTLDEGDHVASAVGISGGSIAKIWTEEGRPDADADRWLDLSGRTLIPGFIDTHNHLLMYARQKQQLNCASPPNESISDLLAAVKQEADYVPSGEWIVGSGYDDTMLKEKRHILRQELDDAAPHHPVFIRHISGHLAVVNSQAFSYCEVPADISDPSGGHFGRDKEGHLDGVLYELPVLERIMQRMPAPSLDELVEQIEIATYDYLKEGITTSTDAAVGLDLGFEEYRAHMEAVKRGKNPIHMRYMVMYHLIENGELTDLDAEELNGRIHEDTAGRGALDSVKLFQDGSIQGYTAALRGGYHEDETFNGDLVLPQHVLNNYVQKFHDQGYRVAIHGNGDLAIASIIEAYTKALDAKPKKHHRHRIEHLQTAREEDVEKLRTYDIATSLFINHVYYWGDRHRDIFLGPERAARINPTASVVENGILYTLHSDCPITPISPLFSIWAAANRITRDGHVLGEGERVSVLEALKSMTIYGARLNGTEHDNGTIEQGKRADFAVLDQNPLKVDPRSVNDINVDLTIIDGEITYERGSVPGTK
ncbi:amidohydrolase [Thalassobacillus sp. CUG 92003]|uniref:amidohydrolase n=1 Tax=Thalassobacillus sp. CUG 92003 TaxID=2736641 RepID=UPI0015E65972|nr:amidohydrolase [Thalassobacillus sp. CUG 92003]